MRLSLLDLVTTAPGASHGAALRDAVELAQAAEAAGYHRVWYSEHHGTRSVASSAPAVLIGHVASRTSAIRVGSGGVMLPNHAPLVVAEQFGMLEALHPGRIDLGVGRAPGGDPRMIRALRRTQGEAPHFEDDLAELLGLLRGDADRVRAVPGPTPSLPVIVLGSSVSGAAVAAQAGLPFAFASHFAPSAIESAAAVYRSGFIPSDRLAEPYLLVTMNVLAARSEQEAALQRREMLRGEARKAFGLEASPGGDERVDAFLDSAEGRQAATMFACTAAGTPETAWAQLEAFAAHTDADEVVVIHQAPTHDERLRSIRLLAARSAAGPAMAAVGIPA